MVQDPDAPSLLVPLALTTGRAELRRAVRGDVSAIAALLAEDQLGRRREDAEDPAARAAYLSALDAVDADPAHDLMVAVVADDVVATMQVTYLPGLSRRGALRAQVEAVRVAAAHRFYERLGFVASHRGFVLLLEEEAGAP